MATTKVLSPDNPHRSVLDEVFELLLQCFRAPGAVKNEWLMPFDPGPSSFQRKQMRPPKRRRRPF
jgi:hypothetical protein